MTTIKPGELVVYTLLRQFVSLSKLKIERALEEDNENNLMKSMHLSDDAAFEQLLESFYMSAEFALPSLLKALIQWYQSQHSSGTNYEAHRGRNFSATEKENGMIASCHDVIGTKDNQRLGGNVPSTSYTPNKSDKTSQSVTENTCTSKSMYMVPSEMRVFAERRDLAIDIVFCQVLLSLLRQLSYHPGHNHLIEMILDQSFRRFKYREDLQPQNSENVNLVADLYAEIVGVLSQSRFALVRSRFTRHLNELRAKENNPNVKPSIVSLIMGMKFFRVKMHPIEDFVNCFTFLQELGQYFLEVKEPEIKHVLSDLFVEILLPVAAVARQEVNIPALKNFVENLYPTSLELASKKKHIPALFPLVTCLLCVGTKSFFLNNWANFMTICLSHLKNRTPKVALVSLQSLSCLLWVYIVRIRGEKHSETQSKLHHIVNSLFPKNQKFVVPKDAPINIFVRIIQFIAHEKLEFAVKEIIIDRLGVNGLQKTLFMPERMNIGLCAFLLIAYGLQQKAGAPPMPQQCIGGATSGVTGGGATGGCGGIRQTVIKRSFLGTNLNDALGHNLGIQNYLAPVRRAFESILRQLDTQVCRVMILPKQEVSQKEVEELMTTERKPKLDLLKTCVACIPRLLPNDMGQPELLELLAKVCLHVDEDLRKMAQQAMANLIVELPAFRVKTIQVFIQFIQKNVSDTSPQKLDGCLKTLFHLLNNWKLALQKDGAVSPSVSDKSALYEVEGFALVMLCHCRSITRRLAVHILRKCRALIRLINAATAAGDTPVSALTVDSGGGEELCCIDVLDRLVPQLLERVLPLIPVHERSALSSNSSVHVDFSVLTERCSPVWLSGSSPMTSYPAVVVPTNFVSNQYSSLMPMNDLDRGQVKDVSEQVTRRAQFSMYPAHTRVDAGEPSNNNNVSSNNQNIKDSIGDVHKSMTSSLYDRTTSPIQRENRRVDHQSVAHAAATFSHSGTPGLFRRACQNQPHHPHHPVQHAQQAYIVQPVPERVILNDVWATCLFIAFSPENLVTACPMAIKYAWSVLYHRLSQLFPIIDPSAQIVENRASSILRSSSKKPTMEREQFFPLWHNYAVLGCCIAPNSTGSRLSASRIAHYQTGSLTEIGAGATSAGTRLGMR
ncbi:Protein furry [Fasciola gigantica]|uniref:Protein furry n=1 Tax=Fasciola gigantica TaxID=46835 RepID=A0A504YMH5_FASGI|nr:Protein furry [Fasciola gigantica]